LQHTVTYIDICSCIEQYCNTLQHIATHCNELGNTTLQHTVTYIDICSCIEQYPSTCLPHIYIHIHIYVYTYIQAYTMTAVLVKSCKKIYNDYWANDDRKTNWHTHTHTHTHAQYLPASAATMTSSLMRTATVAGAKGAKMLLTWHFISSPQYTVLYIVSSSAAALLIYVMIYSYACHDSFIGVPWLIHMYVQALSSWRTISSP